MRRKLRILFAAFEAAPFLKTGGLGDVASSLPPALREAGCEVRAVLPKAASIPAQFQNRMTHVTEFRVQLGWRDLYCGLEQLTYNGVTWYFLDNEYYFKRDGVYGYYDDGERIAFFSRAIAECLRYLPGFRCDVLHCNDWHTALAPLFVRTFYGDDPLYANVKTILTVHNLKFQGIMSGDVLGDILGLAGDSPAGEQLRTGDDTINYMQGGLLYSDLLTTVSPTYAREIQTPQYGEHMEGIFHRRREQLHGILNGIDTAVFDPAGDESLPARFTAADRSGKAVCKAALQKELGLSVDPNVPLVVMVGRLTEQKGLDLLCDEVPSLLGHVQLAVLGTGERSYGEMLIGYALGSEGRMSVQTRFDESLAHRMYAGADLLLMPSLFEPCGLAQMIAMRYGTLPIVRETGGLRDSVLPYERCGNEGTGFAFPDFDAGQMRDAVLRAADLYRRQPDVFRTLSDNAMAQDFSWKNAARSYAALYASLHPEVTPWKKTEKKSEKGPVKSSRKKAEKKEP